jgi:NAD(P)-dependent dehydrogenase (short-subunit alcohol dehydrogenase family)
VSSNDKSPAAVIAGAASVIGAHVASGLAEHYRVLLIDREDLGHVCKTIETAGGMADSLSADLSQESGASAVARFADDHLGALSVYIHCQSFVKLRELDWLKTPVEEWDRALGESVRSAWLGCRALTPSLRANGRSKIVMIGSDAAAIGGAPLVEATSMAALTGVVRTLAREVGGDGVAVNMLCAPSPSAVKPNSETTVIKTIVEAVKFLCSADSDFITGQTWLLNEGRWLQ